MWLFHSLMSHMFVYINLFSYSKGLLLILQIEFVHALIEGKYCKNIFPLAFSFFNFHVPINLLCLMCPLTKTNNVVFNITVT